MIKTLTKHGNSTALIIERTILELLGASPDTPFEMITDGKSLILTPVKNTTLHNRVRKSIKKIGERYSKSFEELAR